MVLSKEELIKRITDYVGTDSSEKALEFLTDTLDTIQNLETDRTDEIVRLKAQLDETNRAWREKFLSRFYSGISGEADATSVEDESLSAEEISVKDLFE